MELYFVRHGESVGNVSPGEDLPDCPLTTKGKEQAKLVGERLREIKFTHILSSPLIRALETAQPLAQHLKQPIEVIPNAYEMHKYEIGLVDDERLFHETTKLFLFTNEWLL